MSQGKRNSQKRYGQRKLPLRLGNADGKKIYDSDNQEQGDGTCNFYVKKWVDKKETLAQRKAINLTHKEQVINIKKVLGKSMA